MNHAPSGIAGEVLALKKQCGGFGGLVPRRDRRHNGPIRTVDVGLVAAQMQALDVSVVDPLGSWSHVGADHAKPHVVCVPLSTLVGVNTGKGNPAASCAAQREEELT